MNADGLLLERGISQREYGSDFACLMADKEAFSATEYKVLSGREDGCFVGCMRTLYNGKVQLYYRVGAGMPLPALLPSLDRRKIAALAAGLLSSIEEVKDNGFLSCQNILLSPERIYADSSAGPIKLTYLPLRRRLFADEAAFAMGLRACLLRLLSACPASEWEELSWLLQESETLASGGEGTWEGLWEKLRERLRGEMAGGNGGLRLSAVNGPKGFAISVTKEDFVLGKKPGLADGVIPFNKRISRVHCRLSRREGSFTVTDLGSTNGTFVNGRRLRPGEACPLGKGDRLRLADSEFQADL